MRRMTSLTLLTLLGALLLASCGAPYQFRTSVMDPPTAAPDFTLTDVNGSPWTLSQRPGKLRLIFFGFTNCPDVCPTTFSEIKTAKERLGSAWRDVDVALITVDPERDTADRLKRYIASFDPSFTALTGTRAELEPVYKAYGVTAIKRELPNSALGYTMDHSAFLYAIDRQGRLRLLIAYGTPIDDMASDLGVLAAER